MDRPVALCEPPHDARMDGAHRQLLLEGHLQWVRTWARPTTVTSRRRALTRYARAIAPTEPVHAERRQVEAWYEGLTTTATSRQCELAHVAGFYRWAVDLGHRDDDPTARIRRPKSRVYVPRPMTSADVRRALDEAPDRIRPWLMLMVGCGLRCCEVAVLTAGDVHRDAGGGGRLFVADGKGGGQRWVPAPQPVLDSLTGLPRRGPLFLRKDGRPGPVSAQLVSHLVNEHLHSVGIEGTAHALRHTYATRLHGEVGDLLVVRDVLGHRSVQTTQRYVQVEPRETLAAASRALEGIVTRNAPATTGAGVP